MVKENSLHFNLASKNLDGAQFKHFFGEALEEMKLVFQVTIPIQAKL